MSLYENFPYTNLHELNLDWLINTLNELKESQVLSVNGMTGDVILYQNAIMQLPTVEDDHWSIIRMADGTQRGIMFANDGTAYIVHGNTMSQVYSVNNQPPYPVTRVNGKTGDITLYSDQYVQLPSLSDAQMQNWTFFRTLNNVSRGIQFNDDGTADIINGNSRYRIYDKNAFPSIGSSGSIVLFTENNNLLNLPPDDQATAWGLAKSVNNVNTGIGFSDNGDLVLLVGSDVYPVYTALNPGWVNDPEDDTIIINTEAGTPDWGFLRETTEGYVGILFSNDSNLSEPAAYVQYIDSNDQVQTLKLLTPTDIPATGVYTVNGLAGTVVLYGGDIQISANNPLSLSVIIGRLNSTSHAYVAGTSYPAGTIVARDYYQYIANTQTSTTWVPAEWDRCYYGDEIMDLNTDTAAIKNIISNVQTVQKQVSTSTTYTCSNPAGEWYTISDLEYTTTKKCLMIINAHLKINSSKSYIDYIMSQSWNLANTSGTQHFLTASYAAVFNANVTPSFQIRLENGDSITYGDADQRIAGITYTIIPLE